MRFVSFVLKNSSRTILSAIVVAGLFCGAIYILAAGRGAPYNPGDTLTPDCAPGETNCTVTAPATLTSFSSTATGLTYTNTTGAFSLSSGYVIPTTTEQTNWNTAYGWGNHALAGYLTSLSGALLATGATTGATSQSQAFTNGVTLSNLTGSGSRCLYVDSNGVVSAKSGDCGTMTGGDDLGSHIATQNIQLGNYWLSGDGGNEGIRVDSTGKVGIGVASPTHALDLLTSSTPGGIISLFQTTQDDYAAFQVQNSVAAWQFSVRKSTDGNPGGFNFYYSPDGSTNWVNAMNLTTTGRVGIGGVTSPRSALEVSGTIIGTYLSGEYGIISNGSISTDYQNYGSGSRYGFGTDGSGNLFTVGSFTVGNDHTAGTSNVAGSIKLFSAGDNAFYNSFTSGTNTANATYTLPTSMPASTGFLKSSNTGVMSWDTNSYEPVISAGTTGQYWRGDKSWQTLDKTAVGLGSVENTALSTWAGTSNITTLGTIVTGVWHGTAIDDGYISSAATWSGKQAAYTNLTSIGALANASGWLKNNGSGTFSYSTPTYSDVGAAPAGSYLLADGTITGATSQVQAFTNGLNITDETDGYQVDGLRALTVQGSTGSENLFLGQSGNFTTTGTSNIFAGYQSGNGITSGGYNFFAGYKAGYTNSDSNNNIAIGKEAGYFSNANSVISVGYRAGYKNTSGYQNTYIGYQSGYNNQTGNYNVAIGNDAGFGNTNNSYSNDIFIGYRSGYNNLTGNENIFMGYGAGYNNSTGANNIFLGGSATTNQQVGFNNTTGSNNIFMGYGAGFTNSTGNSNIFLGKNAGYRQTGSNIFMIDQVASPRADIATEQRNALLYGVSDASLSNQTFTVNAALKIGKLDGSGVAYTLPNVDGSLNQFLTTNGSGTVSWGSYTETDPIVKAINGIVKSNGSTISAAVAGTDYQSGSLTAGRVPYATGSPATLTDSANLTYDGATLAVAGTSGSAQLKTAYDANNYATHTVDSAGNLTIAGVTSGSGGNIILQPAGSGSPTFLSDSGTIVLGGNNNTNNEDLRFDFETTADLIGLSSSTGATAINTGTLNLAINNSSPTAKLDIASTSTTGNDFLITNTGVSTSGAVATITANSATTGNVLALNGTGLTTGSLIYGTQGFAGAGVTGYGINLVTTDATSSANTDYNIYTTLTMSGNAAKNGYGMYSSVTSSSTTADTIGALKLVTSETGVMTTGTRTIYGLISQPATTAVDTGGTTNIYGSYLAPSATLANGSTQNVYGEYIAGTATVASGTINRYGLYIDNASMNTTGTSTQYGLYVNTPSGADNNYAAIFAGGNVGIGVTTPTAYLHLKAGTATASTAPLKFTSGTNLATAEAGAMEFDGTNLYFSPSTTRNTVDLYPTTPATTYYSYYLGGSGLATSTGQYNTSLGYQALNTNATATDNVALGYRALQYNTYGNKNTAIGSLSLQSQNYNGGGTPAAWDSLNVAVGYSALNLNYPTSTTNGYLNAALGSYALTTNNIGSRNVAIGSGNTTTTTRAPLYSNVDASDNIAIGTGAMAANTYAEKNVAIGTGALYTQSYNNGNNTVWTSGNVAIGYNALYYNQPTSNSSGAYNTAIGYQSGFGNVSAGTASSNAFLGYQSGYSTTSGSYNTSTGYQSLYTNASGTYNTGVGYKALFAKTGNENTAVGASAMELGSGGNYNVAVGVTALRSSTGSNNTGVGYQSLSENRTASDNTALGYNSLVSNTYGEKNVAIGSGALYTQSYNNGNNTVWNSENVAVGYQALNKINAVTSSTTEGLQSTALGSYAGFNSSTGAKNVFLGYKAGYRQTTNSNLLIIDNQDRTSTALEATNSLIYGSFNATVGSQTLAFNAGSVSFGSDSAGGTANVAGSIKLFSAGDNAFYNSFTSGTNTANATYTLPTAMPASNKFLQSTSGGVLSWETVNSPTYGTTTQIPYTNSDGTGFLYAAGLTYDGTTLKSLATGGAQLKTAYDASNYATFTSASNGDLTIATATGTTGGDIIFTPVSTGNPQFLSDSGVLVFGGNGNTNNENLTFDFETTADSIALNSTTGATDISWPGTITMAGSTTGTLVTRVYAGAATEGDANGALVVDSTNGRLYFRYSGAWHYVAQTAGFQIPNFETADPITQETILEKDFVLGQINQTLDDGALHGVWTKFSSVIKGLTGQLPKINDDGTVADGKVADIDLNNYFVKGIKNVLAALGINVGEKAGQVKTVKIEKLEMVDSATGDVYCTWIENGEWQKVKGDCSTAVSGGGDNGGNNGGDTGGSGDVPPAQTKCNEQQQCVVGGTGADCSTDSDCQVTTPAGDGSGGGDTGSGGGSSGGGDVGKPEVPGCTDPKANNYNPQANKDDGSCTYDVPGCMDPKASNYNPQATKDDGSCQYPPADGGGDSGGGTGGGSGSGGDAGSGGGGGDTGSGT